MARRIEKHFLAGPAGRLEALLEEPEEGEPREAVRLGCSLPDVRRLIAVGFPVTYKEHSYLETCTKERVFIQSTNDQFGPRDQMEALFEQLPEPKRMIWVQAEDHFFKGALDEFEKSVAGVPV
jgi:alpha/beta superfamily hydrolase